MTLTPTRLLAGAALVLGGLAVVAGSPFRADRLAFDADRLTGLISAEADRVTALDVARWIRERRDDLRVVDLRSRGEFEAYSIPTAERIPIERLARTGFGSGETIVLYDATGAEAAQAWLVLRALGHESVFYVRGGVRAWLGDVINASLAAGASPEEMEAFREVAALSRYFGGTPRTGVLPGGERDLLPETTDSSRGRVRRRGCAL